jgi:hypothetical protein
LWWEFARWVCDVSYSPGFKLLILVVLPLTFVWKLTAGSEDSTELKNKLVAFLVRQQFDVAVLEDWNDNMPIIRATAGACRLEIAKTSPDGWHNDLLRARAAANDDVFTIFRGKVYVDQPTWLTASYALISKLFQRMGLAQDIAPVLRVIARAHCNAEHLPWQEL